MYGGTSEWRRQNPEFEPALLDADWGSLVRFARGASGIGQYPLAYELGLSQSAIARLESSTHPPTIRTLARIAVETECILEVTLRHGARSETVVFNGSGYFNRRRETRRMRVLLRQAKKLGLDGIEPPGR